MYPFFMGLCVAGFVMSLLVFFKSGILFFLLLNFIIFFFNLCMWTKDVWLESCSGYHNYIVDYGFKMGFLVFLFTEVMFFFGIFWFFFDKLFWGQFFWWPVNDSYLDFSGLPLLGTFLLLSSGLVSSWSHNNLLSGENYKGLLLLTLFLGVLFLCVQFYEYTHIYFNLSDGVAGSMFFFMTGFHGFHVVFGLFMLFFSWLRFVMFCYIDLNMYMYEASLIYWHFVDVVWLFLFIFVYI